MSKHVFTISSPAQKTPSTALPDGAITGNGDVTAVLAGTADRIRLYIGKILYLLRCCRPGDPLRGSVFLKKGICHHKKPLRCQILQRRHRPVA